MVGGAYLSLDIIRSSCYEHLPLYLYPERVPHPKLQLINYFDILEHTLQATCLHDYPALIFNMDESGFPLDPKPLKTIDIRGSKNPYFISSGSKSQVSIAACVSAAGQSLSSYVHTH